MSPLKNATFPLLVKGSNSRGMITAPQVKCGQTHKFLKINLLGWFIVNVSLPLFCCSCLWTRLDDLEEPGWESLIAFMTRQVFMIFFMLEQQPVIHESLRFLFTCSFHTHPAHPSDNMHPSDMIL